MAEFLVFTTDQVDLHLTPERSTARYKRGDIVRVAPDGFSWGFRESPEKHVGRGEPLATFAGHTMLIKVPGMEAAPSVHRMTRSVTRPSRKGDQEFDLHDASSPFPPSRVTVHERPWRLRLGSLKRAEVGQLRQGGTLELSPMRFRRLADHKVTRAFFDERDEDGQGVLRRGAELAEPTEAAAESGVNDNG